MSNTVSLCLICKNEEGNIGALLEQICPLVEEVHVTDTGSTDSTLQILSEKAAKFSNLHIHHFTWIEHFAEARNYSFSFATQTFVMWVDSDDQLEDAEKFVHFKQNLLGNPNVDAWLFPYIYSRYADGSPCLTLSRERLVRRSTGRRWLGAIHECLDIQGLRCQQYDDVVVVHHDKGKARDWGRNVRILEKEYEKSPNDERTSFYLGKELFDRMDPRGQTILESYLKLPYRYWDNEINARARLSRAYLAQKRHGEAIRVANEIYHLEPTRNRAEFYWIYGAVEQDLGNYRAAIPWYQRCAECLPPSDHMVNVEYHTWHPRKRIAECYHALKNYDKALDYARAAVDCIPGDPGLTQWYSTVKGVRFAPHAGHNMVTLEFGTYLRYDSYRSDEHFTAHLTELPFADASIDGVVLSTGNCLSHTEMRRVIKPGGFLWVVDAKWDEAEQNGFGYLGTALHQKRNISNYIRSDENKPTLGFQLLNANSAQARYRIYNTAYSAIKKGFPIIWYSAYGGLHRPDTPCDLFFALSLNGTEPGKVNILEVCELLPDYKTYGIEHADVINTSSALLAEALRERFPDKRVINVDDHFEMPPENWL